MLTSQAPRGWKIGDIYRAKGKKVIFGGIAVMLHPEETMKHADSVFLGEVETRFVKQLGGRGQYGHVVMRFEPTPDGSDFMFTKRTKNKLMIF